METAALRSELNDLVAGMKRPGGGIDMPHPADLGAMPHPALEHVGRRAPNEHNQILQEQLKSIHERHEANAAGLPSDAEAVPMPTQHIDGMDLSHMDQHQPHLSAMAAAPILILGIFLILFFVFRKVFGLGGSAGRSRASRALPAFAFDVEGGSADHGGTKALHPSILQAAEQADVSMLRDWVADERCTIDAKMAATGRTALHAGANKGHANVCRLLLDAGADPLCVDNELQTPLHLVALNGHGLCVKALLEAGADPEGKDMKGMTPLQLADNGRHLGTARMMRLHLERRNMHAAADGAHGARRR